MNYFKNSIVSSIASFFLLVVLALPASSILAQNNFSVTAESYAKIPKTFTFDRDLTVDMSGQDVQFLQCILNVTPITGTFADKTKAAVTTFQKAHKDQILTPAGLTEDQATGYVGPSTRAYLNEQLSTRGSENYGGGCEKTNPNSGGTSPNNTNPRNNQNNNNQPGNQNQQNQQAQQQAQQAQQAQNAQAANSAWLLAYLFANPGNRNVDRNSLSRNQAGSNQSGTNNLGGSLPGNAATFSSSNNLQTPCPSGSYRNRVLANSPCVVAATGNVVPGTELPAAQNGNNGSPGSSSPYHQCPPGTHPQAVNSFGDDYTCVADSNTTNNGNTNNNSQNTSQTFCQNSLNSHFLGGTTLYSTANEHDNPTYVNASDNGVLKTVPFVTCGCSPNNTSIYINNNEANNGSQHYNPVILLTNTQSHLNPFNVNKESGTCVLGCYTPTPAENSTNSQMFQCRTPYYEPYYENNIKVDKWVCEDDRRFPPALIQGVVTNMSGAQGSAYGACQAAAN